MRKEKRNADLRHLRIKVAGAIARIQGSISSGVPHITGTLGYSKEVVNVLFVAMQITIWKGQVGCIIDLEAYQYRAE